MEKIDQTLTKQNYVGLAILWGLLALGAIGGYGHQQWSENIYTFMSTLLAVIVVVAAIAKGKVRPLKQFMATYFIHVLFCVSLGWWWLMLWWLAICIATGFAMHNYLEGAKGEESEAKG